MVERVKVLRERLYRLYRGREKLRKAFVEGSLTLVERDGMKRSLESEIAVDEHKLVKILDEERIILHQHLKELNSKHRSGEIDEELYNKAYRKLGHRINQVGFYLSEVDDGKGLYSYLGYGKSIHRGIRGCGVNQPGIKDVLEGYGLQHTVCHLGWDSIPLGSVSSPLMADAATVAGEAR